MFNFGKRKKQYTKKEFIWTPDETEGGRKVVEDETLENLKGFYEGIYQGQEKFYGKESDPAVVNVWRKWIRENMAKILSKGGEDFAELFMAIGRLSFDDNAYEEIKQSLAVDFQPVLEQVLTELGKTRVFEMGSGAYPRHLMRFLNLGAHCSATEISPQAVKQLKKTAKEKNWDNHFDISQVEPKLSMEREETYDILIFCYLFHHYSDKQVREFLEKTYNRLKPGALVAISSYTKNSDLFNNYLNHQDKFYPEKGEIKRYFEDIGFEIINFVAAKAKSPFYEDKDAKPLLNEFFFATLRK